MWCLGCTSEAAVGTVEFTGNQGQEDSKKVGEVSSYRTRTLSTDSSRRATGATETFIKEHLQGMLGTQDDVSFGEVNLGKILHCGEEANDLTVHSEKFIYGRQCGNLGNLSGKNITLLDCDAESLKAEDRVEAEIGNIERIVARSVGLDGVTAGFVEILEGGDTSSINLSPYGGFMQPSEIRHLKISGSVTIDSASIKEIEGAEGADIALNIFRGSLPAVIGSIDLSKASRVFLEIHRGVEVTGEILVPEGARVMVSPKAVLESKPQTPFFLNA